MISLPWPPKELSPNARCHWSIKSMYTKQCRIDAGWATKEAKAKVSSDGMIDLYITFNPPNKRRFDLDNCLSRIKSHLDGIADGLGVNDNRFRLHLEMGDVVDGGRVIVRFLPKTDTF